MYPAVLRILSILAAVSISCGDPVKLNLLNILPFPVGSPDSGWDRAYELIPAAQIAQEQINSKSDLLPGYSLEVVTVQSEPCGISTITDALVNTFEKTLDPRRSLNVVGLGGLFCSSVTNTIAPIFSLPNVTYLQVAASTTPAHRNNPGFPWLVHLLSSSAVFNDAVVGMMNTFGWNRVGLVYDSLGIFFTAIAKEFINNAIFSKSNFTLSSLIPISQQILDPDDIFTALIDDGTRVVVLITSIPQAVTIMCSAYMRKASYPGYVYIFQSRILNEFTSNANLTDCTQEQIEEVMEGVFFIDFSLVTSSSDVLVSGRTYQEYYRDYSARIADSASKLNVSLSTDNIYANVMYDEVWAFALALNASLPELRERVNLDNISLQDADMLAEILRGSITNISFQGASGSIKFDPNRDDNSEINIFQVINGSQVLIATYNADQGNVISLLINVSTPRDTFERRHRTLPLWLAISLTIISSFCYLFTTVILIILLCLRKRPEVKASSLYLNLLIFAGCYATYIAAEMRTASRSFVFMQSAVFTLICNFEVWFGSIGMTLIFSTLLVRLFRIRYIFFRKYGSKRSKFLNDGYLCLVVLILCSVLLFILVPWTVLDRIQKTSTTRYISDANPPYFEIHSICSSENLGIWLASSFSYIGVITAVVVFMAVQTRKIKLSNFKDTKKVNAYVFVTVITVCVLLPLWFVTDMAIMNDVLGHIFLDVAFLAVGFFCQLYIFVPQVFVTIRNMQAEKKRRQSGIPLYKIRPRQKQFSQV